MGLAGDGDVRRNPGLGSGRMEFSRIQIILIMGLMALAVRALPQILFVGGKFPEALDRWLRYVSYALIAALFRSRSSWPARVSRLTPRHSAAWPSRLPYSSRIEPKAQ